MVEARLEKDGKEHCRPPNYEDTYRALFPLWLPNRRPISILPRFRWPRSVPFFGPQEVCERPSLRRLPHRVHLLADIDCEPSLSHPQRAVSMLLLCKWLMSGSLSTR